MAETKPEVAEGLDMRRLRSDRSWSGYLTLENLDAVAERLREGVTIYRDDDPNFGGLNVCDNYGVWGLHTTVADQKAAHELAGDQNSRKRLARVSFDKGRHDGGRIEIEHYAPIGSLLYWVIAVEPKAEDGEGAAL